MAIRTSNQITFTEQKKIEKIEEYYLATSYSSGVTINNGDWGDWTTEIQTIDNSKRYLWNYERVIYSIGNDDISEPIIIGFYGKGDDGKGIADIQNYYLVTSSPELPQSPTWSDKVSLLTPEDKYLWNYEKIIYTDDTTKQTDPAIIGAYGDTGIGTLDFQIYSTDGFEFKDGLDAIELKTVILKEGKVITEGVTYQWSYWSSIGGGGGTSNSQGSYQNIEGATQSTFTVNKTDEYAFTSLKCAINYSQDDISCEDYIVLTEKVPSYISIIKFFDGSNIFDSTSSYLVMYVELYKDGMLENQLPVKQYYDGNTTIQSSGYISTDITGSFSNGSLMYFITQDSNDRYYIVLGQYNNGSWYKYNDTSVAYTYANDLYTDMSSNVIVISKEDISRSRDISVEISKDGRLISKTNVVIMDLNDPIISSSTPEDAKFGQLWLDTSKTPYQLKVYTQVSGSSEQGEWVQSVQQSGGQVYISEPDNFYAGDIWILADGEIYGNYGAGTMLKAVEDSSGRLYWTDAMEDLSVTIKNIKETFEWTDAGMKIAQQVTDSNGIVTRPFYVHIDSTRMGFHDNTDEDIEVVHIGNKSARIRRAEFYESQAPDGGNFQPTAIIGDEAIFNTKTTFNQSVYMGEFVWQTETNGSFSLALVTNAN